MIFTQKNHDLCIPDDLAVDEAVSRTTHLGIGAHQDDLEFMALHGILECFGKDDLWFGGITCTDGAGSSRTGIYANFSDEEMQDVRIDEQRTAARIGKYGFMAQLGHPSSHAKASDQRGSLIRDLSEALTQARPDIVYTHNPFDKHATHRGVTLAVVEAILSLPPDARPRKLFGCEVWRGLDWMSDERKTALDVSAHPNLAASLNGVFDSQIAGGKRYDLAVEGRRMANATFFDAYSADGSDRVQYAVDLSTLIGENPVRIEDFVDHHLNAFSDEIRQELRSVQP